MRLSRIAAAAALLMAAVPAAASAQALEYPAFQLPRVTEGREYNFAFADGDFSRSLVFQWREGYGPGSQLSFDVGFADLDGDSDPAILVGGQYAQQLVTASADIPLDFALTAGANLALITGGDPDGAVVRVPLGVVIGRSFVVDAPTGFAVTPYVHPRASLDYMSAAGGQTDLSINFDVGASFQITPGFAGRLAFTLGGNNDVVGTGDAFGISLALTPRALNRR
jgi:hypothetical protein